MSDGTITDFNNRDRFDYYCPICDAGFDIASTLIAHMTSVHNVDFEDAV